MNVVIKHRNGTILYEGEAASLCAAVEKCVRELGMSLAGATLAGANLAGANLAGADLARAYLAGAHLTDANLAGAYLAGATLTGATLTGANLTGATLAGANLAGADLARAYLAGANLAGATGLNPYLSTPLHILREQPGQIRAYKLVTTQGVGPFNGGLTYRIGESYEVADANPDETQACGAGINLATLDWCLREWAPGYRILVAQFTAAEIVAIPVGSDGRFRCRKVRIVGEKNLAELGWPPTPCSAAEAPQ